MAHCHIYPLVTLTLSYLSHYHLCHTGSVTNASYLSYCHRDYHLCPTAWHTVISILLLLSHCHICHIITSVILAQLQTHHICPTVTVTITSVLLHGTLSYLSSCYSHTVTSVILAVTNASDGCPQIMNLLETVSVNRHFTCFLH